jgi:ATP-binding cassette subfamily B protein
MCLLIVDAAQLLIPQLTGAAVNLLSAGTFTLRNILPITLGMVAVMAVISAGRFAWRYFLHGASRRIQAELRQKIFDHLLRLSGRFYQKYSIGDLLARSTNDVDAIRNALGWGFVSGVDGSAMALAILIVIFVQDPGTAIFAIIPLPLITILIIIFGTFVGRRIMRVQQTYSAMSNAVQETFAGIRVIKSFVKEKFFIKMFADTNDDYRSANMAVVKIFGFFFPLTNFLAGLTTLIVLYVGGRNVMLGTMSPGSLVALLSYLQMLIWPMLGAGFTVNMIQRGAVSLQRVNEILGSKPDIEQVSGVRCQVSGGKGDNLGKSESTALNVSVVHADARDTGGSCGKPPVVEPVAACAPKATTVYGGLDRLDHRNLEIEIRNLSFAYTDGNPVLSDINVAIRQGEWLGIMGHTGCGKSTLVKTLPRIINTPRGAVFIRGRDICDWPLAELRRLFGFVPQDSFLFSDSIRNNIRYGDDSAGAEDVNTAAHLSALDRDMETFALGFDTVIGEKGLTLSGGQKQRTAIARALLLKPDILVMDDSLSACDAETEKTILGNLAVERSAAGAANGTRKTTIIVSHRVAAFRNADHILVLAEGKESEYGTPAELLDRGGYFAKMARLQSLVT